MENLKTFEEIYKTAYSHGLEQIYTLENVDIKSIRPLLSSLTSPSVESLQEKLPTQISFDFGEGFREWVESYLPLEPIQVLHLSSHSEKCLLVSGRTTLGDLINANLQELVFLKGVGQGHIDEIRQKLTKYMSGKSLKFCKKIDFASLLKCLTANLERKKVHLVLAKYHLSEFVSLSPAESVEIGRLTLEQRQEWQKEIAQKLKETAKQQVVEKAFTQMVNALIKPWLRRRGGLATGGELLEHFQVSSDDPSTTTKMLKFLSDFYFDEKFPVEKYLLKEDDLFLIDQEALENYREVLEKAHTYFYQASIHYAFYDLLSRLEREFTAIWRSFPDSFLNKALRYSSHFRVRKSSKGILEIRLS